MIRRQINNNYVFLDKINSQIKSNLLKFRRISIIINISNENKKEIESIVKFAKQFKIPFFIKNSFKSSIKYNSAGIFIESINKRIQRPLLLKKNFVIMGSVHNQLEYAQKIKQSCSILTFSPIFFNEKYSKNKILGIIKFNLITLNWNKEISALGGINLRNLNQIKLTKASSISFYKLIFSPYIKKPAP
jgi:thiamine monophosphate synthase